MSKKRSTGAWAWLRQREEQQALRRRRGQEKVEDGDALDAASTIVPNRQMLRAAGFGVKHNPPRNRITSGTKLAHPEPFVVVKQVQPDGRTIKLRIPKSMWKGEE